MSGIDPGLLDTPAFAGADLDKIRSFALGTRSDLDWYEHPLAHIRRRVVRRAGNRGSLVFLPDGPATIESYDAVVNRLGESFDVAVIEIPGFGFSYPKTPEALEFSGTVAATAAAIDDLGLESVVLVGPCVQGLVALGIGHSFPEAADALIIAQTGNWSAEATWIETVLDPQGALNDPFLGQIALRLGREAAAVDWWIDFAAGPGCDVATLKENARGVLRNNGCYALASLVQKWFRAGGEPALRTELPTTILWGLADASHELTDRSSVLAYAPAARFVELEDKGHFADLEAIDAVAAEATRLLAAVAARERSSS